MTTISLDYDDREVQRAIALVVQRTGDLKPANDLVGEYMLGQVSDRFRTETDPQRRPWQPLSSRTLAQKLAEGKILKILQRNGLMRSRVNYKSDQTKVVIGIGDRKARKHQLGEGVPRREILGVNREDIRNIVEVYRDYVSE